MVGRRDIEQNENGRHRKEHHHFLASDNGSVLDDGYLDGTVTELNGQIRTGLNQRSSDHSRTSGTLTN